MSEALVLWGIGLLALCLVLVLVEVFVPSMGLLSILAACTGVAGLVCLFRADWRWGAAGSAALLVLLPIVVAYAFSVLPSTPFGRRLILGADRRSDEPPPARDEPLAHLLGAEGEALTDLRPVGAVRIADQRLDALSEIGYVRAGSRIRVTSVEGNQVRVRPLA